MAPATALNPLPESSHSLSQTTDMSFQPPTLSALAKAKKDAENALKDLWSLDIRDEQLVAEGFDSSFIKSLVADLGLNGPKSSGPPPEHKTEPSKEAPAAPSSSEALAERQPPAISKTVEPAAGKSSEKAPAASAETAKPDAGTASTEPVPEGRAVRIARRLAEKTQKLAAERAAREAAEKAAREEAAAKEAAEAARAAAVKAEKERRLQQKLAALQRSLKARELERQEAAKPVTPQPAAAPTTTPAVSNQPLTTTKPQQMSVPTNSTDSVASSTQPTRAAASIPGLFLSSNSKPGGTALQAPAPATQRKRPVAADFDDFVESVVPPKRPFGHDRNNTSLVIDVSDGSDSDVEMETESHEDVPAKAPQEPTPSLRRNLSFRDHPPLTDTNSFRKKYSTPPVSSAAHTPVNHVARKLPNLDQEIADLKKKIAEKEARRKNGALARATSNVADEEKAPTDATRSSSSQLASQLPSTSPEPSTVTKRPALPPRNRVTSERLMQVRSGLEEKTARLKALRDEIARLESEVEADRRQHDSLVRELEEAGGDGDDTAQPQAEHGDDGCHVLGM